MNYVEALNEGTKALETTESTSPSLDAEVLLRFVTGLSKEDLISNRLLNIESKKLEKYRELLLDRKKGLPIAYLTGEKEFFRYKFKVNKYVLIPRPETESLVERIAFELKGSHNLKILDIGTGSGCIIVSLAKTLSNQNQYFGSDDSQRALAVAQSNAEKHHVKVKFIRSDLTKNTGCDYDVIVANLPYLTKIDDPGVKFEPAQALVAKKNGVALYERLFKEIASSGKKPLLYLEFGHDQADIIQQMASEIMPDTRTEIFKDLWGVPRFGRIWHKVKN
ncbi:MAG: peptide chain release factor N(5)-glutamine methyltransferase [Candidatus Doudnabacteria bacterium]|nr:peptide chain release factor N(5)-glutamine methyltransferase [Candidatus Doudnabacteria bacterium]